MMFTIHQKRFSFLKKYFISFFTNGANRPGVNRPVRKMVLERIVPGGTGFGANRPVTRETAWVSLIIEPRCEKTGLRGFRPGLTPSGLCSHRRWLVALNFGFRKKRDCTIRQAKTKALISFAVTAKLICVLAFAHAKSRFSHNAAQLRKRFPDTCSS